jgi:hypothetical protein
VPKPIAFESEMAVKKFERCKSLGIDQIPAEYDHEGSRTVHSQIHKLINYFCNKQELYPTFRQG